MSNKNYVHGRAYEYRRAKELRAQGYHVTRSAGSHGLFDLIAIKPKVVEEGTGYHRESDAEIKLLQLKTGKSRKSAIKKVAGSKLKEMYEGLYQVTVEVL